MSDRKDKRIIGLTGGIASGKSTVARLLEEAGIPVVDADQVARKLSEPDGAAHPLILRRFGTTDRAQLRQIVFSDPQARRDLEAILHPLIREHSLREIQRRAQPGLPVIYEAALLVETRRYQDFDGLIVVESPADLRKQRLMERDGSTPELAQKILDAQISDQERREAATFVLENSGSLEDLKEKVQELVKQLRSG